MSSEDSPARAGASFSAPDASLTIGEFCRAEKISRSIVVPGVVGRVGPEVLRSSRHAPDTHRACLDWQREREAEAAGTGEVKT